MPFELMPMLALGLGLMHALDADHVMAVSALSNEKPGVRRTVNFSAHWAIGHGGVLLFSGALFFGLGLSIPESFQHMAESGVGVLLIVLGIVCFWQLHKEALSLDTQDTENGGQGRWQNHQHVHVVEQGRFSVKALLVGTLHGLAGSAPALAFIPAVAQGQLSLAMTYLLLFSIGVMCSMMCFGLGLAYSQRYLAQRYYSLFHWSRRLVAMSAIILGGFWLSQSV